MAGAPVLDDADNQAAAIVFTMENLDDSALGRLSVLREVMRAVHEGRLSPACGAVSFVPSPGDRRQARLKVNIPYLSPSRDALTGLELRSHAIIDELSGFICSAFKGARLSGIPVQTGVRSGSRPLGRATLCEHDVTSCRRFDDGIACGAWPIEEWGEDIRPEMTYMPEGGYYEIPIGCLRPKALENVFVAGRCISASSKAIASARVIGTSLSTGWAAGRAAAYQAQGRSLALVVEELRREQVRGVVD